MTKEEIAAVLAEHKSWLDGSGGKRANLTGANLTGANLTSADLRSANLISANLRSADLRSANLTGANLTGAILREGATIKTLCRSTMRSDGHTFFLWDTDQGFRIQAGCRFFDWSESKSHWRTRHKATYPKLHEETQDILAFFSRYITRHSKRSPKT